MKKLAKIAIVLFAAYWLLLGHVSLNFLDSSPAISSESEDGQYKVYLKDMYPVNPIGLYCSLTEESPIYFALYDAKQNYIGQSSPFSCCGLLTSGYLLFPGETIKTYKDSFIVVNVDNHGELNISTKNKRWWSWFFSLFY